ncbi:GTP 3',8-cyclase MoaA [Acetohalobium arabaticum]|uniref:GTP 3',8-cyclase n=1 Tax=Acetohalobium arabaticum (strain ATCC 49924 / DSM 5501 / Z-7288) TaxID=574087 RepID=D9QT62_ACEAZ|nr:GTP 3',8-cyclase MoaA [Acetohalobium arabaticum]ADL13562.1 GTP cyclohydrolase subunit MoaA [Acetohalobium arabaticum DSM 5501]
MEDKFGREIDYLRVSVTDRCNLRCFYCMPEDGIDLKTHDEILRYEELYDIIESAVKLGFKKIRLTGGEPLVRKGLVSFIEELEQLEIEDLALTTNGTLLAEYAAELKTAGLDRVNISLDTLQPGKFGEITCSDKYSLSDVIRGIKEAKKVGLTPVKLNVVLIKGVNDNEVEDFARMTLDHDITVRFIEVMPLGDNDKWAKEHYISIAEIKEGLNQLGSLIPVKEGIGNGPAKYYKLPNAVGKLGFISPISDHYCRSCNRIRLTADGFLKPCLLADKEFNIRKVIRSSSKSKNLMETLRQVVLVKPKQGLGDKVDTDFEVNKRQMSQIGG